MVTGPRLLSIAEPGRHARAADHNELAGDRRVPGPGDVLPGHFGGAQLDRHRESVFGSGSGGDRSVPGCPKRGVRVRVMVAGVSNDTLVTRYNSVRLYGALLDAGVELYEYNRTMVRHKIMMIDGCGRRSAPRTSTIDRSRTTKRATSRCRDEGVARELIQTFERDLAVCERVTKEDVAAPRSAAPDDRSARVVRTGSGRARSKTRLRTSLRRSPRTTR